ncbi:protease [Myxococcus sp. K15C18031901]|uniref:protease n=1 Tax=Myxococcus dinghuensis TaxID=2906761 RepID=UPI0020A7E613|nr:protease [Myxococcus dinghuensis]MCP3102193.1 protease [Myxococcus dinghuensis]
MTRGQMGRIALLAMAVAGAGCASKREETRAEPQAPQETEAAESPSTNEASPMAARLSCAMKVPSRFVAGGPVQVSFSVTNTSSQPLYVLTWNTPLEGRILNDMFEVSRDGVELPYQGPMVKRAPPTADSYVTVEPGATVTREVDISQAYGATTPGAYTITFRGALMDVTPDKAKAPPADGDYKGVDVKCAPVDTTLAAK